MTIPPSQPFYFGAEGRPLFGTLHVPQGGRVRARVLLCPPLGYEAHFAQITFVDLAAALTAATSSVVMTFDYDGTGDSSGTDDEPQWVPRVLASIHQAIDHLKALPGPRVPVIVIGLRMGGLLAARAVAERYDVDALSLWATPTGKAFLREHRVFSQVSDTNPLPPPGHERSLGARGFEANGCSFDDEAVAELEGMDASRMAKAPAPRVLVLHRSGMPTWRKVPEAWHGAAVEEQSVGGYAEMMEPPWLWSWPGEAIGKLVDWVGRVAGASAPGPLQLMTAGPRTRAEQPGGFEERAVRFGPGGRRFGILTVPKGGESTRVTLFVSSVFSYRIGPNRSNVNMARRLAASGIASLRIDVSGVGDSRERTGVPPTHPYDEIAVEDALYAIDYLRSQGFTAISAAGVCAGAFVCWRAAERSRGPIKAVLANISLYDTRVWTREQHLRWKTVSAAKDEGPANAVSLRSKVRSRLERLKRSLEHGGRDLALASLPARFHPSGLPARIQALARRGSRLVFVYGATDAALTRYRYLTSYHQIRFLLSGSAVARVVEGPDHSFTPRWAQAVLADLVASEIAGWTG
jgi:dienelactone hydrolase